MPERQLTDTQIRILQLCALGYTYRDIGKEMRLSEDSVKKYLVSARAILGGRNGTHAVYLAMKKGLIA
jgi:DNA-binding NarL/FixJ family response regulator